MATSEKSPTGYIVRTTEDLGNYVRNARVAAGLTQEQAADMCNVGRKFIIALEKGKTGLTLSLVMQVLRRFGLVVTLSSRKLK